MKIDKGLLDLLKTYGTRALLVDEHGQDHDIPLDVIELYIAQGKHTVKIEGMENKLPFEDRGKTIHVFISPMFAYAFGEHKEPYDVLLKVIQGSKTIVVDSVEQTIETDGEFLIPANTPHYATNKSDSVMLSIEL